MWWLQCATDLFQNTPRGGECGLHGGLELAVVVVVGEGGLWGEGWVRRRREDAHGGAWMGRRWCVEWRAAYLSKAKSMDYL